MALTLSHASTIVLNASGTIQLKHLNLDGSETTVVNTRYMPTGVSLADYEVRFETNAPSSRILQGTFYYGDNEWLDLPTLTYKFFGVYWNNSESHISNPSAGIYTFSYPIVMRIRHKTNTDDTYNGTITLAHHLTIQEAAGPPAPTPGEGWLGEQFHMTTYGSSSRGEFIWKSNGEWTWEGTGLFSDWDGGNWAPGTGSGVGAGYQIRYKLTSSSSWSSWTSLSSDFDLWVSASRPPQGEPDNNGYRNYDIQIRETTSGNPIYCSGTLGLHAQSYY